MIAAVVFDLDDTLYAERDYALSGFAEVARTFAGQLGDRVQTQIDLRRLFDSDHRPRVFNELLVERGIVNSATLVSQMVEVFRSHVPVIQLFPDAEAALSRLRPRCKLGLITDGRPDSQWAKIDALQLRPRFDAIIVTSELSSGTGTRSIGPPRDDSTRSFAKPHPLAFESMAERLGVAASECVYVADNPAKDFVAPAALGWLTVMICRPGGIYHHAIVAPGRPPKHRIESLDSLDALLT